MQYDLIFFNLIAFFTIVFLTMVVYVLTSARPDVLQMGSFHYCGKYARLLTLLALPSVLTLNIYIQLVYLIPALVLVCYLIGDDRPARYVRTWNYTYFITAFSLCYISYVDGNALTHALAASSVLLAVFATIYRGRAPRAGIPANVNYYEGRSMSLGGDAGFSAQLQHCYWELKHSAFKRTGQFDWNEFNEMYHKPKDEA